MRKIAWILALTLLLGMLGGCAGTTVVYNECTCPGEEVVYNACTCPAGSHNGTVNTPAEGAVKTGLAVVTTLSGANAGEEDGKVEYDVTLVAVLVDDNGVIVDCVIDSLGASVSFDAAGVVTSDTSAALQTKNEKGDHYGMVAYGGATYEWYEQAAALADYAVGKTVDELKNGAVDETGYAADADLASTATIYIGGYVGAIEVAVNNAQHLGAQAGDELRLASISGLSSSTGATADAAGLAQLDCDVVALTLRDGVISSCYIDSLQAKVNFDAAGVITTDLTVAPKTKNELGADYNMVAWGGAKYEWNEQAANFASYVTGKTPAEVAGIAVTETTKPADADLLAGVTISIGGFQALIAKAAA